MKIKYNSTKSYAPNIKKTGKRKAGERLIDNGNFYRSRQWRKCRSEWVKINPLCEHCLAEGKTTPADVVDHIIPYEVDKTLAFDGDNLQSLCYKHHSEKTEQDKKKYPEVYKNYDKYYK